MTTTFNVLPDAAAAVFGIILSASLRFKYADATEANAYYRQMVYAVTLATVTDVISTLVQMYGTNAPPVIFLLNTTVFYLTTLLAGYALFRYMAFRVRRQNTSYFRIQKFLLFADAALILSNLVTRMFFDYEADATIVYGRFHLPVCYGVAFWFILSSCIVQGIHDEHSTLLQRIILRLSGISLLTAFIVQFFFLRNLMFSYAVGILSVYMVFFTVEMPVYVRIEEATKELMKKQEEAKEAAQKALRASRAKSNFLANTSHEIRTPMNAILGMNDMIGNGTNDVRIKSASSEIKQAGESLLQIINDVLDYSRIESGRMELEEAPFSLGTMLAKTDEAWRTLIEAKDLSFDMQIAENVPDALYGDYAKLNQILENLVSNAYKYTNKGSIRTKVATGMAGDEAQLLLSVTDTGIGIRKEELEEVFSLFTRAALEENRDKQGAGLGLKLTEELAQMMGGSVRAESEYGKGSRFAIRLPLQTNKEKREEYKKAAEVYHAQRKNLDSLKAQSDFRADGKRVLVVDDTVVNLTIVKSMVQKTGAQADTVMSGRECLELLQKKDDRVYDLVLLDYMMPEMDGIQTLELIRMIPGCEKGSLPVIALTASIDSSTAYHFLQAGFDDYLGKPVKPKEMHDMLQKHLSIRTETDGAP